MLVLYHRYTRALLSPIWMPGERSLLSVAFGSRTARTGCQRPSIAAVLNFGKCVPQYVLRYSAPL